MPLIPIEINIPETPTVPQNSPKLIIFNTIARSNDFSQTIILIFRNTANEARCG